MRTPHNTCGKDSMYLIDRAMAEDIFRIAVLRRGMVRPIVCPILSDIEAACCRLSSIMPSNDSEWRHLLVSTMTRPNAFLRISALRVCRRDGSGFVGPTTHNPRGQPASQ